MIVLLVVWQSVAMATPVGAVHVLESSGDGAAGVPLLLGGGGSVGWAVSPRFVVEGLAEGAVAPDSGAVWAGVRPQLRLWAGPEHGTRVGLVGGAGYGYDGGHGLIGGGGLAVDLPAPDTMRPRLQAMYTGGTVGDARLAVSVHLAFGRPPEEPEPVVEAPPPEPLDLPDAASMVWMPQPTCEWLPVREARPLLQAMAARPRLSFLEDPWHTAAEATPEVASPVPTEVTAPEPVATPVASPVAPPEPEPVARPRPTRGDLVVVALPGDTVWVNEAPVEVAASGLASVSLDEGRADVRIVGAGRDASLPVAVSGGATVWLQVDDEPQLEHLIRFRKGANVLVDEAAAVVTELGAALGGWRVELRGGYSPEGSLAANEALAGRRAEAVSEALQAAGVPVERIDVVPPEAPDPEALPDDQRAVSLRLLPAEVTP